MASQTHGLTQELHFHAATTLTYGFSCIVHEQKTVKQSYYTICCKEAWMPMSFCVTRCYHALQSKLRQKILQDLLL